MHHTIKRNLCVAVLFLSAILFVTSACGFTFIHEKADAIETVLLGGDPVGIILNGKGLLVSEFINVTSEKGSFSPALQAGLRKGDVILSANEIQVRNVSDLQKAIDSSTGSIKVTVLRNGENVTITIEPVYDLMQNALKIGISVKENVAGIGTLTFIRENGRYGALGHAVSDSFGNTDYQVGAIFPCSVTGFRRATRDQPGELTGAIDDLSPIGTIEKNTFCGIFGHFEQIPVGKNRVDVASRTSVMPGKAHILTTIDPSGPKLYEIRIVKTYHQISPKEKGMVIRIVDDKLLQTTGGILQGMSGSPILQNGKLVGAVTHVMINDSAMGYGVYVDWMMQE